MSSFYFARRNSPAANGVLDLRRVGTEVSKSIWQERYGRIYKFLIINNMHGEGIEPPDRTYLLTVLSDLESHPAAPAPPVEEGVALRGECDTNEPWSG